MREYIVKITEKVLRDMNACKSYKMICEEVPQIRGLRVNL